MLELQTIYMDIKIYTSNRFKQVMAYLIERNKNLEAIDVDIEYIIDKLMSKRKYFGSISLANIQTNTLIVLYIFNKSLEVILSSSIKKPTILSWLEELKPLNT